jgi:hypothetical protein
LGFVGHHLLQGAQEGQIITELPDGRLIIGRGLQLQLGRSDKIALKRQEEKGGFDCASDEQAERITFFIAFVSAG